MLGQTTFSRQNSWFLVFWSAIFFTICLVIYIFIRRFGKNTSIVGYTHCPDKTLNKPLLRAFQESGIKYISLKKIDSLDHTDKCMRKIIYIPCSYNNSDWDIKQFSNQYPCPGPNNPDWIIAAILGCNKLCSKNGIWSVLENTYNRDGAQEIMPESWAFPAQLPEFRHLITDDSVELNSIFILKKNIQGKRGLLLTNSISVLTKLLSDDSISINQGGQTQLIGNKYVVAQRYLEHPFLIQGRKLNIRLYILIIITRDDNLIREKWLLYKHGKCIYTNRKYTKLLSNTTIVSGADNDMPELEQQITSLNTDSNNIYSYDKCPETLNELSDYMFSHGYDWPNIWQKIQLGLVKVARAYKGKFGLPKTATMAYQIFGADYIISSDPATGIPNSPYLLEFNKGPEMKFKSPSDSGLKLGLQKSVLDLVLGNNQTVHEWAQLLNPPVANSSC